MHGFQPRTPQFYINPLFLPASGSGSRLAVNPATLEPVGQISDCHQSDIRLTVDAANVAHDLWRLLEGDQRKLLLHQLADSIDAASALNRQIVQLMILEQALTLAEASHELKHCAAIVRYYADLADTGSPTPAPGMPGSARRQVRYEPYGVSVHILPFAQGIVLMCRTVAAALAAGNSCIVKPAEHATLSTLAFMQHFVGLPAGLVSCLPGDARTGQWLLQSSGTHAVAFTGSVAAGSAVAVTCAELLKPCVIESAGRGSMIVSRHARLDLAAACGVSAAFGRSGQTCLAIQHFFVEESIHDQFVRQFIELSRVQCQGHQAACSIGPLISEAARQKVMRLVNDALAKGATRVAGADECPDAPVLGWFHPWVILTEIDDDMAITQEECLGPVALIRRVTDLGEAVQLANDCPASVEATLFCNDPAHALLACQRLLATRVRINPAVSADSATDGSHWFDDLSPRALDAFRRPKTVVGQDLGQALSASGDFDQVASGR
ncbi:aldehyde dehydrogenase [Pseudomonas protegens]|uniref:aldehyde dehydrogenase family protein n=1 Tax=Pseudomonas protegens TaxID=380021 RepID=UPI000F4AF7BD|nr:aldehyde dehydrogenase [Pseudomonas protegens]ROL63380.1 aldehyde dehydrogenase [Pseudomonas protegens]